MSTYPKGARALQLRFVADMARNAMYCGNPEAKSIHVQGAKALADAYGFDLKLIWLEARRDYLQYKTGLQQNGKDKPRRPGARAKAALRKANRSNRDAEGTRKLAEQYEKESLAYRERLLSGA